MARTPLARTLEYAAAHAAMDAGAGTTRRELLRRGAVAGLGWEVSRAQPGTSGILVDYTGGRSARASARARSRPA
jgi:hypothetical protein